jgi:hypothetical protein
MQRALLFITVCLCATPTTVQSADPEALSPLPEPRLESYRAVKGIDPAAWQALRIPATSDVAVRHARLPRFLESGYRTIVARNPAKPALGTLVRRISPLEDGYLIEETESGSEQSSGKSTELTWMGLVVLHSRRVSHMQIRGTFTGSTDFDTVAVNRLEKWGESDLSIDQMKPGYRFRVAYDFAVETDAKGSLVSRHSKRTVQRKLDCEAAAGGAAQTLAPGLSGDFLKVTCLDPSDADARTEYAYLQDYAYFILTRSKTRLTDSDFKVMAAKPAPSQ